MTTFLHYPQQWAMGSPAFLIQLVLNCHQSFCNFGFFFSFLDKGIHPAQPNPHFYFFKEVVHISLASILPSVYHGQPYQQFELQWQHSQGTQKHTSHQVTKSGPCDGFVTINLLKYTGLSQLTFLNNEEFE